MDPGRRRVLSLLGLSAFGLAGGPALLAGFERLGQGLEPPRAPGGRRLALAVDVARAAQDAVADACVGACHRSHRVPRLPDERQGVRWMRREAAEAVFPVEADRGALRPQRKAKLLLLCNHCQNPPCVRVCPTGATWRRDDGLVMSDAHRCIGCRSCMVACPYGARSFNFRDPRPFLPAGGEALYPARAAGVVEKCTLCAERLSRGLGPACVQAAAAVPGGQGALVFGDLNDPRAEIGSALRGRIALRRKTHLGTEPQVYYLL